MTTKNKNLLKKAIFLLSKKDFEKMSNIIEPEEIEEIETTFKNLSYILTEVKFEPKRPRFEFCDKYNSAICSSQMIWKKLLKNEDKTVIGKMIIFKYKTRNNCF
ncbi:hypothetical protein MHBO_004691 [Bonamia ostreae]|uniref:Uncharacterized protein n=1 Tax=Bonamia ostreae TaxID=126728 RepID=A0ABV2AU18_9EUKA